jgi:hypothetical protein
MTMNTNTNTKILMNLNIKTNLNVKMGMKTMIRVCYPVCSRAQSLDDFWFFGHAKERMKDQIITSQDNRKDKWNLIESGFHEWSSRLECGIEHEREYCVNPHWLNRSRVYGFPEKKGDHNFRDPLYLRWRRSRWGASIVHKITDLHEIAIQGVKLPIWNF